MDTAAEFELTALENQQARLQGRILIADDDEDFRRLLVHRARRMGLDVVEVETGAQAMAAVKQDAFDVAVLDIYMPGCSGLQVAESARKLDRDLQTIVLTGSQTFENALQALRVGVHDYLTKPLDSMASFELALSRALEHRRLVRENARLFAEVQRLAVTDPLTGLSNRHRLSEVLGHEAERARRLRRPMAAIMLDMDGLKALNDACGHEAGDQALQVIAAAIRKHIRRADVPIRCGGDEFLILLPEADLPGATGVAKRISDEVSKASIHGHPVRISGGVACEKKVKDAGRSLVKAADAALYRAKRAGKGKIVSQRER
jgi:two-component system cell cycle response regulator